MKPKRPRSKNASITSALHYFVTSLEFPTNKAYAEAAGVNPSQVSLYLSGKVHPRDSTLERLVRPFDVTVEELKLTATILDAQAEGLLVALTRDPQTGKLRPLGTEPSSALVEEFKTLALQLDEEKRLRSVRKSAEPKRDPTERGSETGVPEMIRPTQSDLKID